MKYLAGFMLGVILTIPGISIYSYFNPSERDLSILINITNDTDMIVESVILEATSNKQKISCTLRNNICSLAVFYTGDTEFIVSAILSSGELRTGEIGYSDPGSNRLIRISQLKGKNT